MQSEHLCCDDAAEHLEEMLASCEEFAMVLELTAPRTPQQNGVVVHRFVILKQQAVATMIAADLANENHFGAKLSAVPMTWTMSLPVQCELSFLQR
jgi:hypothetical protein